MADGRHLENGFIAISPGNHPISTKFSEQTQNLVPRSATRQTIEIFPIQNGGRPPY